METPHKPRARNWVPIAAAALLFAASGASAQVLLQSGPQRVALVELYTSQGCNTCPPADRWLSGLEHKPDLWQRFVPVAFHVDYWDYIGWRDPFARPGFSQRQRQYADEGGVPTVYTPGMLLNGEEWRDWRRGVVPKTQQAGAGTLVVKRDGDRLEARYLPTAPGTGDFEINVALLGCGLRSDVTAGENRGKELANDFVVLDLRQAAMRRDGKSFTASLPAFAAAPDAPRLALAAWVSTGTSLAPLQAAGSWLTVTP